MTTKRTSHQDVPCRMVAVDRARHALRYRLSAKGRASFPLLVALRQWGEEFFFAPGEAHVRLVDREHRQPLPRLEVCAEDGGLLTPDDTVVGWNGIDRR